MDKTEKRFRFEKVAANRVQRIVDCLGLLQNCSNKNNYEYTEAGVALMFDEIQRALKEAKDTFEKELNKTKKKEFSFGI